MLKRDRKGEKAFYELASALESSTEEDRNPPKLQNRQYVLNNRKRPHCPPILEAGNPAYNVQAL